MPFSLSAFLKKTKNNFIRNWKEQDDFQKYGGLLFLAIVMGGTLFAPKEIHETILRYLNFLCILYLIIMFRGVRKAKRELIEKNKEIELQKQLIEEKQKEIVASIRYAKRIQISLLPTEKYIERNFKRLNKN